MLPLERPDDHAAAASSSTSSDGGSADERAGPCGKRGAARLPEEGRSAVRQDTALATDGVPAAAHAEQPSELQAAQEACDAQQQQQQQQQQQRDVQKPRDVAAPGVAAEQNAATATREPMDIDQPVAATEAGQVEAREPASQAAAEQPAPSATPGATCTPPRLSSTLGCAEPRC